MEVIKVLKIYYFFLDIIYSWFHKKGTFSVHSFNDDYLSIPERPGSYKYLFHEIPGTTPPPPSAPAFSAKPFIYLFKFVFKAFFSSPYQQIKKKIRHSTILSRKINNFSQSIMTFGSFYFRKQLLFEYSLYVVANRGRFYLGHVPYQGEWLTPLPL